MRKCALFSSSVFKNRLQAQSSSLTRLHEQGLHASRTPELNVGVKAVSNHAGAACIEAVVLQHELKEEEYQRKWSTHSNLGFKKQKYYNAEESQLSHAWHSHKYVGGLTFPRGTEGFPQMISGSRPAKEETVLMLRPAPGPKVGPKASPVVAFTPPGASVKMGSGLVPTNRAEGLPRK